MSRNILVLGGTRFFGRHLVQQLLEEGEQVTIATRGITKEDFGNQVGRILFDRSDEKSIRTKLSKGCFDVVYDNIAYNSSDIDILLSNAEMKKYIVTSSVSVYNCLHMDTAEADFDPEKSPYRLLKRNECTYSEGKQSLEEILAQKYPSIDASAVRFPYVIGLDDYTRRFKFYVKNAQFGVPMNIDNVASQMSFISSAEAGRFLAFLRTVSCKGPVNAAAQGTVSIEEIFRYIEEKTGKKGVVEPMATDAPYNGTPDYSICTSKAEELGFVFSKLDQWLYELIDQELGM